MKICRSLSVLAFAVASSSVAVAAPQSLELVSPSLQATEGSQVECRIVNLSARDQPLILRAYNSDGGIVWETTLMVASGRMLGIALPDFLGVQYCRFVLPGGRSAADFRASINIFKFGFGIISALPAY